MGDWQPMETAPKDGQEILICHHSGQIQHVVFFDDEPTQPTHPWCTADGICYHVDYPKWWMPLPAPPNSGGTEHG